MSALHVTSRRETYTGLLHEAVIANNTEERRRATRTSTRSTCWPQRTGAGSGARFLHAEPIAAGVDEGMQAAYGWSDLRSVPTGTLQWTVQPRGGEPQPDCT
jgi:hypothetical protein